MRTTAPILLLSALILVSGAPIARAEHDCPYHTSQEVSQKQSSTPAPAGTKTDNQELDKALTAPSQVVPSNSTVEEPTGGLDDLGDVGGDFEE